MKVFDLRGFLREAYVWFRRKRLGLNVVNRPLTVSEGIIDAQVNPLDNNRSHNNVCTVDMLRMRYHSLLVNLSVRFGSFRWEIHDACRDCLWVYQCVSLRAKLDTKVGKTDFTADHFSRTSSKITRLAFPPLSQRLRSRASTHAAN